MPSTNTTQKLKLSKYVGTDEISYLQDYNEDMRKIDEGVAELVNEVTELKTAKEELVAEQKELTTMQSKLEDKLEDAENKFTQKIGDKEDGLTKINNQIDDLNAAKSELVEKIANISPGKLFATLVVGVKGVHTEDDVEILFGDDATENSNVLQLALNDLSDMGGTVIFREGVYKLDARLAIPSNVTLQGMGMNSTQIQTADIVILNLDCALRNLAVKGISNGSLHIGGSGILIDGCDCAEIILENAADNDDCFSRVGFANSIFDRINTKRVEFSNFINNEWTRDEAWAFDPAPLFYECRFTNNSLYNLSLGRGSHRNTVVGNRIRNAVGCETGTWQNVVVANRAQLALDWTRGNGAWEDVKNSNLSGSNTVALNN